MTDSNKNRIQPQNDENLTREQDPATEAGGNDEEILVPQKSPDIFEILHCFPTAKSIVTDRGTRNRQKIRKSPAPKRSYIPGQQKFLWDTIPALWKSETMRPIPNPTVRGSLFGLIQRGHREVLSDFEVYRDKNIAITYTGTSLGQDDLDVWMYILQKSGQRFIDPEIEYTVLEFSITKFLAAIGWGSAKEGRSAGGKDKKWLMDSLARIGNGTIRIIAKDGREYVSNLINEAAWDPKEGKIFVGMNARIGYLFSAQITLLSTETRERLAGDQLALWLYNFIMSNRTEKFIMYSVENIMIRCRTRMRQTKVFKHKLAEKMNRLMELPQNERNFHAWIYYGDNLIVFYDKVTYEKWKMNPVPQLL